MKRWKILSINILFIKRKKDWNYQEKKEKRKNVCLKQEERKKVGKSNWKKTKKDGNEKLVNLIYLSFSLFDLSIVVVFLNSTIIHPSKRMKRKEKKDFIFFFL